MKNKGFTFIELILYIALFSLLIGSAFVTMYQLVDGSATIDAKTIVGQEGDFVIRKLDWALTGIKTIISPSTESSPSDVLAITRYDGNSITFRLKDNAIEIKESAHGNTFLPITTHNIKVTRLDFNYIEDKNESPSGIQAMITIEDQNFFIIKYIR